MKPTREEFDQLIKDGKLPEMLWSWLNTGEYKVYKPVEKGWSPKDITPDPSHPKSVWGTEYWWYVDLASNSVKSTKLKPDHYMSEPMMETGNYFQNELQAQVALEKITKYLQSSH